jgi:hypothetical protein
MTRKHLYFAFLILVVNGCVDPYNIKSVDFQGLLIVEGFISSDFKQHNVKLSRASQINKPQFIAEIGAKVTLQIGNGSVMLIESSPGIYLTPPLRGIIGETYALVIVTKTGQEVRSDEVVLRDNTNINNIYASYSKNTPNLNNGAGIQIFLDTDENINQGLYYRWEYEETWEVQTPFESNFVWLRDNIVVFRSPPVSTCFPTDTSSNIIIRSTASQSNSSVKTQLIKAIPADNQAMAIRYSILVRQYTLSEKGYQYWETLKKVNQTQGTLYDTQPGIVIGNMLTVNDRDAVVLGYFDACVVKEKRAFFAPRDFREDGFTPTEFYKYCSFISALQIPDNRIGEFLSRPENKGLEIVGSVGFGPSTLFLIPSSCCNCTNVGTNIKPSFWP